MSFSIRDFLADLCVFCKIQDADSSFGDDVGSVVNYCSVTESIYNYRVENGRTYHAVCISILIYFLLCFLTKNYVFSTQTEVSIALVILMLKSLIMSEYYVPNDEVSHIFAPRLDKFDVLIILTEGTIQVMLSYSLGMSLTKVTGWMFFTTQFCGCSTEGLSLRQSKIPRGLLISARERVFGPWMLETSILAHTVGCGAPPVKILRSCELP
jgi:hypothetical protein